MVSKLDDFVNKTFLSLHKIWLGLANPRTRVQGSRGSARRARRGEGVRLCVGGVSGGIRAPAGLRPSESRSAPGKSASPIRRSRSRRSLPSPPSGS